MGYQNLENSEDGVDVRGKINSNFEQTLDYDADAVSALNKYILERLTEPVDTGYINGDAILVMSTFCGWRYLLNFNNPFRVIQIQSRSSKANHRLIGLIRNEAFEIVANASAIIREATVNTTVTFIFNSEINSDLLGGDTKFYFSYQSFDDSATIMDGSNNVSGDSGIHDLTVSTQYITTAAPTSWQNVVGATSSRKCWMKLFSLDDLKLTFPLIENLSESIVSYDSLTNKIISSFSVGLQRGDPFTGWGAEYDVELLSFNVLRMRNFRRAATAVELDKWQYIQVYVKNNRTDADVLAKSPLIKIDKEATTIEEVILPLMNSDLTEVVTLNNTSFSGATYFIGYLFFNERGQRAYGGETAGTISNYAGTSWYNLTIDHSDWTSFSGNPAVPFDHLLMVNDFIEVKPKGINDLQNEVAQIANSGNIPVRVILPDEYQVVVGDKFQLFLRGIIEAVNPFNYHIDLGCDIGNQFPRYYEVTPVIGDIGNHTLTVNVYDQAHSLLGTAETIIKVVSAVAQPSTTKNVLCVGDSLTAGGIWTTELKRRLADSGGSPVANNYGNINFIGSVGSAPVQWVGYGGKDWEFYLYETDSSNLDVWVYCTHDKDAADQLSVWQDSNGNNWTLEEIEASRLKFSHNAHTTDMPVAPDSLTHVSGATHTTSISYTSTEDDGGNPFWDDIGGQVDFTEFCSRNGFSGIDVVYTLLTWNGISPNNGTTASLASLRAQAETFIDYLHADYPSAVVKIIGLPIPSILGGLGTNYTADVGYSDYFGLVRTVMGINLTYQAIANDPTYSGFVEFINMSGQFDADYNYPETTVYVNSRNSVLERRQTNGVHPKNEGYYQIADAVYRNFIKNFCQ